LYGLLGGMMSPSSLERSVTISSNSTITACSLVQAGCGVALVEPMGVADLFPETVQRPLTPRAPIYPRAIYRASEPLSRIAEGFLKTLQHEIEISQP
jgi:DNA-binding transcriptional LysR family regulator